MPLPFCVFWAASSIPALMSPESAMAKKVTQVPPDISVAEAALLPENCLSSPHYVRWAAFGVIMYVGAPFLTLIPVLSESDQPALLKLPVLLAPLKFPVQSVPPSPPWPSTGVSVWLEPHWCVPPASPWPSAGVPVRPELAWSVPLALP